MTWALGQREAWVGRDGTGMEMEMEMTCPRQGCSCWAGWRADCIFLGLDDVGVMVDGVQADLAGTISNARAPSQVLLLRGAFVQRTAGLARPGLSQPAGQLSCRRHPSQSHGTTGPTCVRVYEAVCACRLAGAGLCPKSHSAMGRLAARQRHSVMMVRDLHSRPSRRGRGSNPTR